MRIVRPAKAQKKCNAASPWKSLGTPDIEQRKQFPTNTVYAVLVPSIFQIA